MTIVEDFLNNNLGRLGYANKKDLIERLYLGSLTDAYGRIAHTISKENDIRDRFITDLYQTPSELKNWLDLKIIYLDWENWKFKPDMTLARADISFKLTGVEFIIECKRLSTAEKAYFDEGLTRFITHHYAKGDIYAGMIAFVISDRDDAILKGLKEKSKSYSYVETPFSNSTFAGLSASFQSSHERTDKSVVNVYHLLFSFSAMPPGHDEAA